jgi:ribosomal protein L37AE/L43A
MSGILYGASTVQSGRSDSVRDVGDARAGGLERRRLGILRRRREVPARIYSVSVCPACGLRIRDLIAARLGFCDRCREFTGMCAAGRSVVCPDMMTRTTWHIPCTELGVVAWEITVGYRLSQAVLCRVHDTQVRYGGTPWIVDPVPLGPPSSRPRRKSANR